MDCVYLFSTPELRTIANSGPFNSQKDLADEIGKSSGSVRKLFSTHGAKSIIDTKRPRMNELGKIIYNYIKDKESIELFNTAKPTQLLELYVSSEFPELFFEITNKQILTHLRYLKREGLLRKEGQRIVAKTIENVIRRKEGTFRFLTPKAKQFIDDVNNVFNLMSYYSAGSVIFRRVDEDPKFWLSQLSFGDYKSFAQTVETIGKIESILKKTSINEKTYHGLKNIKGLFQIRTSHLPLARLGIRSEFTIEGREIIRQGLDKHNNPHILIMGQEAYFGSDLPQNYYPIALVRENSGQLISLTGELPKRGEKVTVVRNPAGSGWAQKQEATLKMLGAEAQVVGDASTYLDIGDAITAQKANFFSVTAPMNHLAEIYGYKTITFPPNMKNLEQELFNNAVLLIKKDVVLETPETAKLILDECQKRFGDFIGSDVYNLKFEHFIGTPATRILNGYCKKCLDITNNEFEKFVDDRRYNL